MTEIHIAPAGDNHYEATILERTWLSYAGMLYKDWKSGNSPMPGAHKLYCWQGGSRFWEFGYRDEMEKYAAEAAWLKDVATVSRPWGDTAWHGETGGVDDLIRKYTDL